MVAQGHVRSTRFDHPVMDNMGMRLCCIRAGRKEEAAYTGLGLVYLNKFSGLLGVRALPNSLVHGPHMIRASR